MPMPPPQTNPMMMLQQMLQQQQTPQQPDPRAGAIEQYMKEQGQQSQMPMIYPEQYIESLQNPPKETTDQGTDEDLLNHLWKGMEYDKERINEDQKEYDKNPYQPSTDANRMYEAWVAKHGREPKTDAEMEEAYGSKDDDDD